MLAEIGRYTVQARDIGLGVCGGGDLVLVDQESGNARLDAEHLIEGVAVATEREGRFGALQFVFGEAPGQLCLIIQLVEIEAGFHLGDGSALQFQFLEFKGLGRIAPFAVTVLDAEIGLAHRVAGHGGIERGFEPGIQALGFGGHVFDRIGGRRGLTRCRGSAGGAGRKQGERNGSPGYHHGPNPVPVATVPTLAS